MQTAIDTTPLCEIENLRIGFRGARRHAHAKPCAAFR